MLGVTYITLYLENNSLIGRLKSSRRGYLAPEFYSGKFTFASDIYSLGVVILEILTGVKGYSEGDKVRIISI